VTIAPGIEEIAPLSSSSGMLSSLFVMKPAKHASTRALTLAASRMSDEIARGHQDRREPRHAANLTGPLALEHMHQLIARNEFRPVVALRTSAIEFCSPG
jgi:hypothetical protein